MLTYQSFFQSPLGLIQLVGDDNFITEIKFVMQTQEESVALPKVLRECKTQLIEYFAGERKNFDIPLSQSGTDFQQRVWKELQTIPFGKTISYLQLAKKLGDAKVIRAAGTANGKNKIAIIVPCHRVIGTNGSLTGYAGGLDKKKWLLDWEGKKNGQQVLGWA